MKTDMFIDPSHSNWILGGIFREIYNQNATFFNKPKNISKIRSKHVVSTGILAFAALIKKNPIIFSSLTPLQNFTKIFPHNSNLKFLWYTHSEVELTEKVLKLLNKTKVIFVHSLFEKEKLINSGVSSRIIPVIGAIQPEYFNDASVTGNKIAWIGTSAPRKKADLALKFSQLNPQINFKFFVKNWDESDLAKYSNSLRNVEFFPINSPLKSTDFDGCSHHLILSDVEGGPMSLLETLAAGLIPISTRVGFVEELLCKLGYESQLLTNPFSFENILEKYIKEYPIEHRKKSALTVKDFTYKKLSDTIRKEVSESSKSQNIFYKKGTN